MPEKNMKPDLHCHSYYSDGKHSPAFLVQRALANQVTHLAITDHDFITWDAIPDEVAGQLQLIPGVEISAQWQQKEIHIVGLCINSSNSALNKRLGRQRQARRERMVAMNGMFEQKGITGLLAFMKALPCESWTRGHVAEFLVRKGHCKNFQQAFRRFLSRNGTAHVPIQWLPMNEVIALIKQADGIPVLAHPSRYGLGQEKSAQW